MSNLSIATDFAQDTGCPLPHLQAIAEGGFTHVHWCHHWNTDFVYADAEIEQIRAWLAALGLGVTDLHASAGNEKGWGSEREYERLAGVELVANRMEMTARLGSEVAVLHLPEEPAEPAASAAYWERLRRSLDALERASRATGVRLAFENGGTTESWSRIARVLSEYGPDFAGLCYDCGHGNMGGDGLGQLAVHADRLLAIHLHDNDGSGDQHMLPFMGTVDWPRLLGIIAASGYGKWISLEVSQGRSGYDDTAVFMREACDRAGSLARDLEAARA